MATVTSKGRMTLPREVRSALGLTAGSEVAFEIMPDGVRLRRCVTRAQLEKWVGCLPPMGEFSDVDTLTDDLREA